MITKIYKILLDIELEEETVKVNMVKWMQDIDQQITLESWGKVWKKNLRFTRSTYLTENYYKMFYRWHLSPLKLAKIKGNKDSSCWKCKQPNASYYHMWWECPEATKFWKLIHAKMQDILQIEFELNPKLYLLNIMEDVKVKLNQDERGVVLYLVTAARLTFARHWKVLSTDLLEEWIMKVSDLSIMDKLTMVINGKTEQHFQRKWEKVNRLWD